MYGEELTDDQYSLDEADKTLLGDISAPQPEVPVEGNPVPEDVLPEAGAEPTMEGPEAPLNLDDVAATPSPVPTAAVDGPAIAPVPPATSEDIERKQGELNKESALINQGVAERNAAAATEHGEDERLAYADFLGRRKQSQDDLDSKIAQFDKAKITNPRDNITNKQRLSVIFGGLGAALTSAGGGSAHNEQLGALQKKWEDDVELQKANIGLMKDRVVMARARVNDADDARATLRREADAHLLSQYNVAIKQGEAQLKRLGVPQAEVDTDRRLATLRAARAEALLKAQKANDEHAIAKARVRYLNQGGSRITINAGKEARAERREDRADTREERQDASDVMKEVNESLKDFKAKNGIRDNILHAKQGLDLIGKDPKNPGNWVHLVDAMVRSNTGKAVIMSQYQLFMGHTAPSNPEEAIEQFRAKFTSGLPSAEQQKNILGSARGIIGGLQKEAKEIHDNFRETYDNDSRLKANPRAWEAYNRVNKTTFGVLPGYENEHSKPAAAKPAAVTVIGEDEKLSLAKEAIKPNSGATQAQRAKAAEYIKGRLKK